MDEAREAYEQVIAMGHLSQTPRAQTNLGILLEAQGDIAGARTAFRAATESAHPEEASRAALHLAVILSEEGDLDDTLVACQQVERAWNPHWALNASALRYAIAAALQEKELEATLVNLSDKNLQEQVAAALEAGKKAFRSSLVAVRASLAIAEGGHLQSSHIKDLLDLAAIRAEAGEPDEARAGFQAVIDSDDPTWAPLANLQLGTLLLGQNRLDEAFVHYQRAIASGHPHASPAAQGCMGLLLQQRGDLHKALQALDRAVQLDPDNPQVLGARGDLYWDLGRFPEALEDYRRALELDQDNPETVAGRGLAWWGVGRTDEALADFDRALELEPGDPVVLTYRADLRRQLGRTADAITDYDDALESDPTATYALLGRGWAHWTQGHVGLALADFGRAWTLEPDNIEVLDGWCRIMLEVDRLSEAAEAAAAALPRAPRDPTVLRLHALARAEAGDYRGALTDLEAALSIQPDEEQTLEIRTRVFIDAGSIQQAIDELDRLVAGDPARLWSLQHRAEARLLAGRHRAAMEDIATLLEQQRDDLDWIHFLRGLILVQQGNIAESAADFEAAKRLAIGRSGARPDAARNAFNLAHYLLASGDESRAFELYRTTLSGEPTRRKVEIALREVRLMLGVGLAPDVGSRIVSELEGYLAVRPVTSPML